MRTTSFLTAVLRRLHRRRVVVRPARSFRKRGWLRLEELESRALPSVSGVVPTNPSAAADAVAFQVVGGSTKLLVAGFDTINGNQEFGLWRFNSNGTLDKTFGQGGLVTTDFGPGSGKDQAGAVALAVDPLTGDIVLGGFASNFTTSHLDFAVAVYHADGTPEAGFGSGGSVTTDFGAGNAEISALAIDPTTHQIVVAGSAGSGTHQDFALARYNFDGSLDRGFGAGGIVLTDFGSGAQASALAIDAAGHYVVAGSAYNGNVFNNDFALARYNPDGSLDSSFGAPTGSFGPAGTVTTDFGFGNAQITALAIDAAGQYVVAGSAYNAFTYNSDLALARYNADGSLDARFGTGSGSFGPAGTVTTDFGTADVGASALVIDPRTQDLVVGGSGFNFTSSNGRFALLARYQNDGDLDHHFGAHTGSSGPAGTVTTSIGSGDADVGGLAVDDQGDYVAAGSAFNDTTFNSNLALVRYRPSGHLDTGFGAGTDSFGPGGTVTWEPDGSVPWQPGGGNGGSGGTGGTGSGGGSTSGSGGGQGTQPGNGGGSMGGTGAGNRGAVSVPLIEAASQTPTGPQTSTQVLPVTGGLPAASAAASAAELPAGPAALPLGKVRTFPAHTTDSGSAEDDETPAPDLSSQPQEGSSEVEEARNLLPAGADAERPVDAALRGERLESIVLAGAWLSDASAAVPADRAVLEEAFRDNAEPPSDRLVGRSAAVLSAALYGWTLSENRRLRRLGVGSR